MTARTASGKAEQHIRHLADLRLGEHKGSRRVWLEGRRLADVGFKPGTRYSVAPTADGALRLKLGAQGDHVVSHKAGRPVVDLLTRVLGDVERVQVRFMAREVVVDLHPVDRATRDRLARVQGRVQGGQPLRLGSLSHGGGVASDALLRGLGNAQLAFGLDIEGKYIEQSLEHGPLSAGGMSVQADLGVVQADLLGQVELLEAGLPCVAASRAGRAKKGLARPEQDANVAHLVYGFLRVIEATQPAVIVLENVPEYAESASADIIRGQLQAWGYTIHEHSIDGAAWSLENRQRWAMVAVTAGLDFDLGGVETSGERPAALGEVLDKKVPASAWRSTASLQAKAAKDKELGRGFSRGRKYLGPEATNVPTLRRGYQKGGSCDARLAHPTRKNVARLFSPAEHARIKGIPAQLVEGLSDKVAHEVLGQSVISPAFTALGRAIGQAVQA